MPPGENRLAASEIALLKRWVQEGANWPDGVDLARLVDRRDHWSFKPLQRPQLPEVSNKDWPASPIDYFILQKLEQNQLEPVSEADRVSWLRRVCFDLTGLPPTPLQLTLFLSDSSLDAKKHIVDELLASPRYGERQAQHWLDVVRYADTHGFEVNTERKNAWPYRDYVINAMNQDKPYDQFIHEQLAGDVHGQDAATGFLVTASVLLPRQIGKDEPSIRLARQDSLDEIVVNIGQTFLGLTIGCARCHDHKFDAISQRDYFSMQAFVAGVEYKDRLWKNQHDQSKQEKNQKLLSDLAALEAKLLKFVPIAQPDQPPVKETSPQQNTDNFKPINARFLRFTIHNSTLHPNLGLIEPVLDELEIYGTENPEFNLALSSYGTKVTASGSRTSARHKLEHIHDGQYGNNQSWMSHEKGKGSLLFELPESKIIQQVIWSRDREGKFKDRLPVAYTIEAGESPETLQTVVHVPLQRSAVSAVTNVERIEPVLTSRLRFNILQTNSLEPCLDELEIFDVHGINVASAELNAKVRISGEIQVADQHDHEYLNDGQFGNNRSWLSNEVGKGWVEIEFPSPQQLERIVWSRDRTGEFQDRLPIAYHIEILEDNGNWKRVADSTDRVRYASSNKVANTFVVNGLTAEEVKLAEQLLKEKEQLESRISDSKNGQLVFAGQFRTPDDIHLLRRGDPEQPTERIEPAVLTALGEMKLPVDAPEQKRRQVLADWITAPENPLTARVMANRIWLSHFGHGIVRTPNDFGRNGLPPSHPELLDWLAAELIDSGWSIKHLHRLIVLSRTYSQSSTYCPTAAQLDTDRTLLWSYPGRRLEGESIRDAILQISGQLNLNMGGPGFDLFDKRGGLAGFNPIENFSSDGLRRLIYAHKIRRERDAVFGAFDCPDGGQSLPNRIESTTPIQALNLFNSQFVITAAHEFSTRVEQQAGADLDQQIREAYLLALCRLPDEQELVDARDAVASHGLATLCRALLNSNEFLFIP